MRGTTQGKKSHRLKNKKWECVHIQQQVWLGHPATGADDSATHPRRRPSIKHPGAGTASLARLVRSLVPWKLKP